MIKINKGSCIGTRHLKHGIPNQDYCSFLEKNNCIFSVMCDGVSLADVYGTVSNSQIASKRVCKNALIYFKRLYRKDINELELLNAIYNLCKKNLQEYITANKLNPNFYHSTIILTLFNKETNTLFYSYVGDSGIVIIKNKGIYTITERDKNQIYVDSILNVKNPTQGLEKDVDAYLLMTDGIYQAMLRNYSGNGFDNRLLNDFLFNTMKSPKKLTRFLNQLPSYISDDDKSVLVVQSNKFKEERFNEKKYNDITDMELYLEAVKTIQY